MNQYQQPQNQPPLQPSGPLILTDTGADFEPCPPFNGRAVCVDVTPPKMRTAYGTSREYFRVVFEVDLNRADGTRWCVWSRNFACTIRENSLFRKFIEEWFGRSLTADEAKEFNTETLVGMPGYIVVVHHHENNKTYTRIATLVPYLDPNPLVPSGQYIRLKDRQAQPANQQTGQPATQQPQHFQPMHQPGYPPQHHPPQHHPPQYHQTPPQYQPPPTGQPTPNQAPVVTGEQPEPQPNFGGNHGQATGNN